MMASPSITSRASASLRLYAETKVPAGVTNSVRRNAPSMRSPSALMILWPPRYHNASFSWSRKVDGSLFNVMSLLPLLEREPLPGNAGMVAGFWCRKRDRGNGLIKKGCDDRQQLLGIHAEHEVAGIRDDSRLSIGNESKHLNRVLERAAIIMIARPNEDGCFDRFQLLWRKSLPLHPLSLGEQHGPVCWIGCHLLVVFSRKLHAIAIG